MTQANIFIARGLMAGLLTLGITFGLHAEPVRTASVENPTKHIQTLPIQRAGTLKVARSAKNADTTILVWTGQINHPMAKQFEAAIAKYAATSKRFLIQLNSPGGSVPEGEKVITLLRKLKETHQVDTLVRAGWTCGSMCPFIFAQGEHRYAAPASMWLFHEIVHVDVKTGKPLHLNRQRWLGLIDNYFVPAGVSERWLDHMTTVVRSRDLFASGDSLMQKRAGLITKRIPDVMERNIPAGPEG